MEEFLVAGEVSEIARFCRRYGLSDLPYERLCELISKHLEYKTLEVVRDKEIVALCRYNINEDTCEVVDAIVHPDYRKKNLLKVMLIKGLQKFPQTKYLSYKRGFKNRKEERKFNIYDFLNIRRVNEVSQRVPICGD